MSINFLFYANIVVWLGVASYVLFLAKRQAALSRRLEQLELAEDGRHHG
jgi:CcmD family protein